MSVFPFRPLLLLLAFLAAAPAGADAPAPAPIADASANAQAATAALFPPATAAPPAAPDPTGPSGPSASAHAEWLWEIDAYYSSAALELPLGGSALPDGGELPEREVYVRLLRETFRPRLLLLEASVYPLPVFGSWYKRNRREEYDNLRIATVGETQLNILEGVTAGFQEPWAVSAFLGSGMQFTRAGETANARNRGYMGYLVSYGSRHIRNNVLIDDNWWELEWKLKGEREFREQELEWSFRLGLKTHGHPDIADVAYLGLRRSDLNYESLWLSFFNNSDLELLTEVDRDRGRVLRQEAIIGRKLPLRRWRLALGLDLGLIYENGRKYTGTLADASADSLTLVFRPHLRF
ncbi:MAG: hypothetical protein V4729_07080 [Pseudomonadota bacterium]